MLRRIKGLLKELQPVTVLFFGWAGVLVMIGFLTGFSHRVLHVICVAGSVLSGLLWQLKHELEKKE